jgi:hypothetical protein
MCGIEYKCQDIDEGNLMEAFIVYSGERQGCALTLDTVSHSDG